MDLYSYFSSIQDGFGFIIAFGSLLGFLITIVGLVMLLFAPRHNKGTAVKLLLISLMLLGTCGVTTGMKYFRL